MRSRRQVTGSSSGDSSSRAKYNNNNNNNNNNNKNNNHSAAPYPTASCVVQGAVMVPVASAAKVCQGGCVRHLLRCFVAACHQRCVAVVVLMPLRRRATVVARQGE